MAKTQNLASGPAFIWAVVKKYRRDDGSRLGALITYYGFLSLFPLLLAVTSGLHLFLKDNEDLKARIAEGISHYFPVISDELQSNIHTYNQTGSALLVAVALTIYGALGGANAIRYSLYRIWQVPREKQMRFPATMINSVELVIWGGGGLVLAAVLSSYAAGISDFLIWRVIALAFSLLLLVGVFYMIFKTVIKPPARQRSALFTSAVTAAIGVFILQAAGGYILTHELKNLSSLYGAFALFLGLFFWTYLQVLVLLFAAEAGSMRVKSE